jgi:hypothetical protein
VRFDRNLETNEQRKIGGTKSNKQEINKHRNNKKKLNEHMAKELLQTKQVRDNERKKQREQRKIQI